MYVLIAVCGVAAAAGLVWAIVLRSWAVVAYGATAAVGTFAIVVAGSPWVGAKAIATAAPAVLLLALLACAALLAHGRRVEAYVVGLAIAGGVLWSNALAYREVWLAPKARLAELEQIGKQFAGRGPALMTEFEPYGGRHFLRRLDAEGASELRRSLVALRSGQPLAPQTYADIDRIQLSDLLAYRTLVLRRSPVSSLPPSPYALAWRGRWYDVWQRRPGRRILDHLPLGGELDPSAVASCSAVLRLARTPGVARLRAVTRAPVIAVSSSTVDIPAANSYRVWVSGTFLGRVQLVVDGRAVASEDQQLQWPGQFIPLARMPLAAGTHEIELHSSGGGLRPGSRGAPPFPLGSMVVAPEEDAHEVEVEPAKARTLCGRRFDWIEALG